MQPPQNTLDNSRASHINKQLRELVFVAFDTETTGLNPETDKLVELAAIKFLLDGTVISNYSTLIHPGQSIPERSSAIHGITDAMVADAPSIEKVIPDFIAWLNSNENDNDCLPILVAHNAPFDIGFIQSSITYLNLSNLENYVACTLKMSYKLVNDILNYQLRTLTEYFGIQSSSYHRALADSQHVVELFRRLIEKLPPDATLASIAKLRGLVGEDSYDYRMELSSIQGAIDSGAKLKLQYHSSRVTERVVTPLATQNSRGYYYLKAYCHLAGEDRTFRMDRITKMEIVQSENS